MTLQRLPVSKHQQVSGEPVVFRFSGQQLHRAVTAGKLFIFVT